VGFEASQVEVEWAVAQLHEILVAADFLFVRVGELEAQIAKRWNERFAVQR